MQVQSALFFESPEEIYARVYAEIHPRTQLPRIIIRFCRFANLNSHIRLRENVIDVRISDLLEGAPAPILEALAWILLSKLFRREVPRVYSHRYRMYLNRLEMRHSLQLVRRERGRKFISGPQGVHYNLAEMFEVLNREYFQGLLEAPSLGWSRRPSRTTLGHFDPSHHAIILSKLLDRPEAPELLVRFVLYHEMLHLRFPVEHKGPRRCVHSSEFREAERQFAGWNEARQMMKKL